MASYTNFLNLRPLLESMPDDITTLKTQMNKMRSELDDIKKRMVEQDSILTEEDYVALLNYRKEKIANKLTSHKDLKKELGL